MTLLSSDSSRRGRYTALFGFEPAQPAVLEELEQSLGVTLPDDFKKIAGFYSGGVLGGISHHAIATSGPAASIRGETIRLRKALILPQSLLILAEPAESLIVMDTAAHERSPTVLWIDANDASALGDPDRLHSPQVWQSYGEFFDFLLSREEEERQ